MTAFRLALFYAAYFGMIGIMMPFWPVWLESKGLTTANIGMVIGSATFVRVFFNPLVAHVADRRGSRQPIIALLAALAVVFFSFFFISDGFWLILIVTILFFCCWGAMQPLGESLTMLSSKEQGFEYGRVRLWGSLAFIATAIIAGRVSSDTAPDAIMMMTFGSVMLMFAVTLFLPKTRTSKATGSGFPIAPLLRNKAFLMVLVAAALIQSSHAVYYGFGTIHWQKAGISDTVIGVLWAEGVIAEVILFSMGAAVLRYTGPMRLIILGGAAGILRWLGTGLDDSLPGLFVLQALHGLTFGATHLGVIHFISDKVPEELSATALSLYSAVVMGLAMGLMVMASGHLYGALGGQAYFVVAGMAAVGGLLAFIVRQSNIQIVSNH
ncbi:MAG: 3-phenylpropionate MFS transporter [Rhodospirillaceae bacterium]|nr:3-phenylpropionate MFS transporter [Rhodospirillaceae bacterium]